MTFVVALTFYIRVKKQFEDILTFGDVATRRGANCRAWPD